MDKIMRTALARELEVAAQAIASKYGFSAQYRGGSYDAATFTLKIEIANPEKKQERSAVYSEILGLPLTIIGSIFRNKTKIFTITGVDPSKPKYCILLVDQNGKGFKCSKEQYLRMKGN